MSTRSGKRIHSSFHENLIKPGVEKVANSERKTRSRRLKENVEEFSDSIKNNKRRTNYVSYPTDDEVGTDVVDSKEDECKPTRLLRKNALKELNLVTPSVENVEPPVEVKKSVRTTRRTRKFTEETPEDIQENVNHVEEINMVEAQKSKKGKKKRLITEQVICEVISKKKTKKKVKKGRKTDSLIVEDIEPASFPVSGSGKDSLNQSNMSIDSHHSAAGSPLKDNKDNDAPLDVVQSPQKDSEEVIAIVEKTDAELDKKPEKRRTRSAARLSSVYLSPSIPNEIINESRKRKSSVKDLDRSTMRNETFHQEIELEATHNNTFNKPSKKRKSSIKDSTSKEELKDATFDKEIKNSTFDLEDNLANRISIKNDTFDKIETSDNINTTFEKNERSDSIKSTAVDTTFDKDGPSDQKNTTYDKETSIIVDSETVWQTRKSEINTTYEKSVNNSQIESIVHSVAQETPIINTTFEKGTDTDTKYETKTRKSSIRNTTFDKDNLPLVIHPEILDDSKNLRKSTLSVFSEKESTEMNSTYDKIEKSDSTFDKDKKLDITFDKSSKTSLLSSDNSNITYDKSDVSRISITSDESKENIANETPIIIESSLDESQINSSKLSPKSPVQAPLTPLKREGTFTKDSPEAVDPAKPKLMKTPTKQMSLPLPGFTPFPTTKTPSKEMIPLNITRSIEKSRRSSLAEPLPRTTKVMFCSPVNNPSVVLQRTRKIVKSNLKGSNKSFVFDESTTTESRPQPRKRSYTQSDADDATVKRKRLVDGLQHSVDRLSRPRTSSASGKLVEPTEPSKKPGTPKKSDAKISRTKLPNFAVLHQKQFDKMESLGECQERKAKRAKQLLTPTGAVTVLERSISPKDIATEPQKTPNAIPTEELKKQKKEKRRPKELTKNPVTPVKSLPTLKSLNPGYTRFGFRLNLDANPFSVSKNDGNGFSFSNKKDMRSKTSLFSFSSRKDSKFDNAKPLKEIKANLLKQGALTRQATQPSLTGTTSRKEVAKQTVMREKSFTDKRSVNRNENRTVIKGVRTNRRFELQMRMRNID